MYNVYTATCFGLFYAIFKPKHVVMYTLYKRAKLPEIFPHGGSLPKVYTSCISSWVYNVCCEILLSYYVQVIMYLDSLLFWVWYASLSVLVSIVRTTYLKCLYYVCVCTMFIVFVLCLCVCTMFIIWQPDYLT